MPLSVAAMVYCLTSEFVKKAEPDTIIQASDLFEIGTEFDVMPSLNELTRQGWLTNPSPGIYQRRELDNY